MVVSRGILNREAVLNHMLIPIGRWHILPAYVKKAVNFYTDGYGPYPGTGKTIAVGHSKHLGYFILTRESKDADMADIIWSFYYSKNNLAIIRPKNRWEDGF